MTANVEEVVIKSYAFDAEHFSPQIANDPLGVVLSRYPVRVIAGQLGVPASDHQYFRRWLDLMMKMDWAKHCHEAAALPVGTLDDLNAGLFIDRNDIGANGYYLPRTLAGHALQLQARGRDREALSERPVLLALGVDVFGDRPGFQNRLRALVSRK